MVRPVGASTPEENAPPRMGAGRLGLLITRLDKATSLDLFHCREYGSISLRPVPSPDINCAGQEDSRWEDSFDVQDVRDQFPALDRTHNGRGVVYLEPFRRPPRADAREQAVRDRIPEEVLREERIRPACILASS